MLLGELWLNTKLLCDRFGNDLNFLLNCLCFFFSYIVHWYVVGVLETFPKGKNRRKVF